MIVDLTNELLTEIKLTLPKVNVSAEYPSTDIKFPCVTIAEISNNTHAPTIDSDGENHCDISIEINIYCNSSKKISEAKEIRKTIDGMLSEKYRMTRVFSSQVPNFLDERVYRYILRYNCIVDENRKIYRR